MIIRGYRVHPAAFTPIIFVVYFLIILITMVDVIEESIEPGTGYTYGQVGRDGTVYQWSWESTQPLEYELYTYASDGSDESTTISSGVGNSAEGVYRQRPGRSYNFMFDNEGTETADLTLRLNTRASLTGGFVLGLLITTIVIWVVLFWFHLKKVQRSSV